MAKLLKKVILLSSLLMIMSTTVFAVDCTNWWSFSNNGGVDGVTINGETLTSDASNAHISLEAGSTATILVTNAEHWMQSQYSLRYNDDNHSVLYLTQNAQGKMQGSFVVPNVDFSIGLETSPSDLHLEYYKNGDYNGSIIEYYDVGETVTIKGLPDGWTNGEKFFNGWNTKNDFTGTSYKSGDTIEATATELNLYAKWVDSITYWTVSFETNGGNTISAQQVEDGQSATRPATPIRAGYEFKDWYLEPEFQHIYNFGAVTDNIIVYAKWAEIIPEVAALYALPTAGSTFTDTITAGGSNYSIKSISCRHGYEEMNIGDTFVAGETYTFYVFFKPNIGYAISRTESVAKLNDEEMAWYGSISDGNGTKGYTYTYTLPNATQTTIDSVSITGVTAPVTGEAKTTDGITTSTTGVTIDFSSTLWLIGENTAFNGSLFEPETVYGISIVITPNNGYVFADTVSVTINGNPATSVSKVGEGDAYRAIHYFFPATEPVAGPDATITSVSVGNVDIPEVGESQDDVTNSPTSLTYGGPYSMAGFGIKVLNGSTWEDFDGAIQAGKTYRVEITLSGGANEFDENITDGDITINGQEGKFVALYNENTRITIAKEFSYETLVIDSVSITGVTAPITGETKTTEGITTSTAGVTIDFGNTIWLVGENTAFNDSVFEAETVYGINVVITPNEGYVFADTVTATINGNTVASVLKVGAEDANRAVRYYFPATEVQDTTITTVSVGNVDIPEVGENKYNVSNTPTSLTYGGEYSLSGFGIKLLNGSTWEDYDGVIQVGKTYRAEISLSATSPYTFYESITDDDITINEQTGKFVALYNYNSVITIAKEFTYDPIVIDAVSITGVTAPVTGETKTLSGITTSTTGVTVALDSTIWTLEDETAFNESVFEPETIYGIAIVVTPNEGYEFADTVTATINGSSVDVSKIGPENAYRVISCRFPATEPATSDTSINTISVGNVELPKVGEGLMDLSNSPASLTYGGEYSMTGFGLRVLNGSTWEEFTGGIEGRKTYRAEISLSASDTYTFNENITDDNITINGQTGKFVALYNENKVITVAIEFGYEATYTVEVYSGIANPGIATEGTVISITASAPLDGKEFDRWIITEGVVELKDATQPTTTFVMPPENVVLSASYKDIIPEGRIIAPTFDSEPLGYNELEYASVKISLTKNYQIWPSRLYAELSGIYPSAFEVYVDNTIDALTGTGEWNNVLNVRPVQGLMNGSYNAILTLWYDLYNDGLYETSLGECTLVFNVTNTPNATYKISVNSGTANPTGPVKTGTKVTITANTPEEGKEFDTWTIVTGGIAIEDATNSTTTFYMGMENVEVTATYKKIEVTPSDDPGTTSGEQGSTSGDHGTTPTPSHSSGGGGGGGGGSAKPTFRITTKMKNGTVTPSEKSVQKGGEQLFRFRANDGYEIVDVIVDGQSIGKTHSYKFENVTESHKIEVITGKKVKQTPIEPDVSTRPADKFVDVKPDDWFYENVNYVVERGLFNGTSETTFDPNMQLTRGMIVTVLYRLAGANTDEKSTFDDVDRDMYYSSPIAWASKNGYVNGVGDNKFLPESNITRQDLAAIIYRYVKAQGKGFADSWMFLLEYADKAEIADYAYEPICWLTMNNILSGKGDNMVDPTGLATRAETAKIMELVNKIM